MLKPLKRHLIDLIYIMKYVRKLKNVDADIIRFVKQNEGKSGIVYCLSRKRVEELAQVLQVNGVKGSAVSCGFRCQNKI